MRLLEISTKDLTVGEKLLIWRRREGYTQKQAAKILGFSRTAYQAIEKQNTKCSLKFQPHVGSLYSHEICFILRRRSGWTIKECADQIEMCRYWYNLMELGKANPEKLIAYWSEDER